MINNNDVQAFTIKQLLSSTARYVIPMYQRNYAWGEGEINQLVQDILDYQVNKTGKSKSQTYYIGTLVVFERSDGSFEVIDGQQRFTTLSLLSIWLKNNQKVVKSIPDMSWYHKVNLDFESRPASKNTVQSLYDGVELKDLHNKSFNSDVVCGYTLIAKALDRIEADKLAQFCNYLFDNVQISRIQVPKDTDLNHYFEVINNRGEQLEKHEIIKAKLMAVLSNNIPDSQEKNNSLNALALVWDACSNMERYVQYGFTPKHRDNIFGDRWDEFVVDDFDEIADLLSPVDDEVDTATELCLADILKQPSAHKKGDREDDAASERFSSIINFSNFLLHVLRVRTSEDVPLDDKQLLQQFDKYLLGSKVDNQVEEVKDFVFALLTCKYLFDHFIIKRELSSSRDGWSLLKLYCYKDNDKSVNYIAAFSERNKRKEKITINNNDVLMLQAAFHVSTPTLAYKYWLNGALNYLLYELYDEGFIDSDKYLVYLKHQAKQFVFKRFLAKGEGHDYYKMIYGDQCVSKKIITKKLLSLDKMRYGTIENNFVFNYLDYLLWSKYKDSDAAVKGFEFTARSSVEHFYPQHPNDGYARLDDEILHSFGNLCLISHSKNSRLSNLQPTSKQEYFELNIQKKKIDSLKVYEMIKLLKHKKVWSENEILEHEESMLNILLEAANG